MGSSISVIRVLRDALIYNPTKSSLNIRSDINNLNSIIKIYDVSGKLIKEEKLSKKGKIISLKAGVYLIRINTEDGIVENKKVVIY